MAIKSGLAGQVAMAKESVYGTYVAPTRWLEFETESVKHARANIDSKAIRSNMLVLRTDRWKRSRKGATGTIVMPWWSKGMGILQEQFFGIDTITTTPTGTISKDHTSTIVDPVGKSLSIQVGRPDQSGTVQPFSYLGGKIDQLKISNSVDGYLESEWQLDFQDVVTAQSLGAFAPPSGVELLTFVNATISVGGSQKDCYDFSLTIPRPQKTDRYFLKNSDLKKEPIINDLATPIVEINADFESLTEYNRFTGDSTAAITATWQGTIIEAALRYQLVVTIPAARTNDYEVFVNDLSIVPEKVTYQVLDNGAAAPITWVWSTTDTVV